MTQYKHVFSPFKFGNVEIKNRIELPPMIPYLATPEGWVTRDMIEYYRSFAKGGAGIVTVGDSSVDHEYANAHNAQLNLGDDRVIGGLSTLVEVVQKYGAKISIEIDHSGRNSPAWIHNGRNPIAPSPIPSKMAEQLAKLQGKKSEATRVQEMNQDMIDEVIDRFASACLRCKQAGFEMVMIHGGHGQLLSQFVSPMSNKRTDHYGGSLENRARFVIEVLSAIRERVGNGVALEYRISGDELVPEGMHEEETIAFIKMIQDKIDLVHISLAGVADPKYQIHMVQPTYLPHAYNVQRAARIKKAVNIPVTCVGSISDLAMADEIIKEGKADIVAMGRAHLADPEIVNKTYRRELNEIRPCLRCNTCGVGGGLFCPIRCAVNPVIGREIEYGYLRPAEKKKKVVIVGGGPAGMEAAQIASSRGHQVTLYEKEKELGGALRYAVGPSFKGDMKKYLDWMVSKTMQSSAEVKLSTEATVKTIKTAKPDALILAVGAKPIIPDIPGIKNKNVVWAGDVYIDKVKTGHKVVVAGAGLTGCETALHLAMQGKQATIIDMVSMGEMQDVTGNMILKLAVVDLLGQNHVEIITDVKLVEIKETSIVVIDHNRERVEIPADTLVLSLGFEPLSETVKTLKGLAPEVYVVGDCSKPRDLMSAIHNSFFAAAEL